MTSPFRSRLSFLSLVALAAIGACEAAPREALDDTGSDAGPMPDARADRSAPPSDGASNEDANADEDVSVEDSSAADANDGSTSDAAIDDATTTETSTEASTDASAAAPTVDGVIAANEYGAHVDGQNQQTVSGTTWLMTYTDTHLHVAVVNANLAEAAVLYISTSSVAADGGTASDGASFGYLYDSTKLEPLPVRASFVAYVKSTYNEWRAWDGSTAWGAKNQAQLGYAGTGNTREFSIPWSLLGGKPTSFAWLGYVTTGAGFAYGEMPPENPSGAIGTSATFPYAYSIASTTVGTGTKPFAVKIP